MQLTSVVCLWVFLPIVLSFTSELHAQLGWNQEIDLAIVKYSTFYIKNSWVAFAVYFGSLSICTMKRCPINFAPFDSIWTESANGSRARSYRYTAPPCFTDDVVCFGS